ncbi:MAG: transposase [Candidatus Thermoplasmatota archaeon]|nr:transposase [Candidatus Thermoplasmatota archaeon]
MRRFLQHFKTCYGDPLMVIRDGSPTLREAITEVFPNALQQEDHWHFLDDLGPVILPDYAPLQQGLTGDHGISDLTKWSRKLPLTGSTLQELEKVWIRLALEWIEEPRRHAGGFPWRLPYLEIALRMEQALSWTRLIHRANADRRVVVRKLTDLMERLERLLSREAVKVSFGRLVFEVPLWEGIRQAMRAERERRSHADLLPLAEKDIADVQRQIDEAGTRFVERGGWAEAIWARVWKRFEDHDDVYASGDAPQSLVDRVEDHKKYLWVVVPGLGQVIRSTVALERAHRDDRHSVIRRRGQGDSGEEMGRIGSLLAFWSNARCPFFTEQALTGVNLWDEFAKQDETEVSRRTSELSLKGQRPTVAVPEREREAKLRELVKILSQPGPIDEIEVAGWAASVGASNAVRADDGL